MTKDELMNLVNRSRFATIGYTDEEGRPNLRMAQGTGRASDLDEHKFSPCKKPDKERKRLPVFL